MMDLQWKYQASSSDKLELALKCPKLVIGNVLERRSKYHKDSLSIFLWFIGRFQ